jgi:Carboxypeptidase regulatory-like domain
MPATRHVRLTVVAAILGAAALLITMVLPSAQRPTSPQLAAPGNHFQVSAAQSADGPIAVGNGNSVGGALKHDTSKPLREMTQYPVVSLPADQDQGVVAARGNPVIGNDPVVQSTLATPNMPSPALNFEGIDFPGVSCNCAPPDTNGEVGATQYVQIVNEGYQVFDKTTGASVYGPVGITTIWSGFGGVCQGNGEGDPVALYDQLANRWLVSQFAGSSQPTDECVAVSTTSDATGSWNRYDFHLGSNFYDYPKIAVWPDGYYMSINVFNSTGSLFLGPQAFVMDRTNMLAGNAATFQMATNLGSFASPILPADLEGSTPPPAGAPDPFVQFPSGGSYTTYRYHVDWTTPANSTFTSIPSPAAAAFSQACGGCVPQPGTTSTLDTLADRLMFRLTYRNFGDHDSLLGSFTVASGGVTGVRWFELRNITSGTETVYQESTFQPDSTYRWMPSAAMDKAGDIAVGYSASSTSVNPSLRYAGRLVGDPLGSLAQGEAVLFAGLGSQSGTSSRWGDYSDVTVDPVDGCTFWFTSEYYPSGVTTFNWRTRIGSFSFSGCGGLSTTGSISGTVTDTNDGTGIAGATVTLSGGGSGSTTTDGSGNYAFSNLNPAGYTVTASKTSYTAGSGSSANVTVTAGNTSSAPLTLTSTLGSISGHVTDSKTLAAISGATVQIASGASTVTDSTGAYTFSGLTAGTYSLTASKTGYVSGTNNPVSVTAGQTTTSDFALAPISTFTTAFIFPGTAPTAVTSGAGDNNGYESAPASWWVGFDGNVATDASSGTGSSQTCGSSVRDQETFSGYSMGSLGSTILGIQVQLRGRVNSSGNAPKFCIQLSNNGGLSYGQGIVTSTLKTTLTTYTLGTTSSLWGLTWTPSSFGSSFRVKITDLANSTSRAFYLDGVSVGITYQ